jgi:hypothetical protein
VLQYALNQEFDLVFSESSREHLHFFAEAGAPRTMWLPFFNVPVHGVAAAEIPDPVITFVGHLDAPYLRRREMLRAMAARGLPVFHKALFGRDMAEAFASSQICFNCSLNGDLNYRVGEVLAAGGCLLTDRLADSSGLTDLFEEDEELVLYDAAADLIAKAERLLDAPETCRAIAARGRARYLRDHAPDTKIGQLLAAVFEDRIEPRHDPAAGFRARDDAFARAAVFEFLLELHRENDRPEVLFHPGIAPAIFEDAADLPRLRRHRPGESAGPFHAVLISARELAGADMASVIDGRRIGFVVVPDLDNAADAEGIRGKIAALGARTVEPCPIAFDCRAVRSA